PIGGFSGIQQAPLENVDSDCIYLKTSFPYFYVELKSVGITHHFLRKEYMGELSSGYWYLISLGIIPRGLPRFLEESLKTVGFQILKPYSSKCLGACPEDILLFANYFWRTGTHGGRHDFLARTGPIA